MRCEIAGDITGQCHLARPGPVDVVYADEGGLGRRGQVARVMATERTHTDDADGERRDHAGTPRPADSTKERNRSTSGSSGTSSRARAMARPRLRSELKTMR